MVCKLLFNKAVEKRKNGLGGVVVVFLLLQKAGLHFRNG